MDHMQTRLFERLRQKPEHFPSLLRLIAEGEPVALDRLALLSPGGVAVEQVVSWLRAQPGTDWDDDGRLLGFGLTQRPTEHRLLVGGQALYAFCAADTLLYPPILGRAVRVESRCPHTGASIRVEVGPAAVTSLEPAGAVVSQLYLGDGVADLRAAICDHGHFFASADVAAGWLDEHPDGSVDPVLDVFTAGLAASRELGWTVTDTHDAGKQR